MKNKFKIGDIVQISVTKDTGGRFSIPNNGILAKVTEVMSIDIRCTPLSKLKYFLNHDKEIFCLENHKLKLYSKYIICQ